jgi:hypothetical protein
MTEMEPGGRRKTTGFAAFGELASVISTDASNAAEDARRTQRDEDPLVTADGAPHRPTGNTGPYQGAQSGRGASSVLTGKGKLIVGVVVAVGAIWLFTRPDGSTYAPPAEIQPPAGTGITLTPDQIRYCLSENIRIDGAQGVLNRYNESDIDRFNYLIADYNSRCSNFRYRQGSLESVRAGVEANRARLLTEGAARFSKNGD